MLASTEAIRIFPSRDPVDDQSLTLSTTDAQASLSRINAHKVAIPNGIPGCMLKACAKHLAEVFTGILNLSLTQAVPTCFKTTSTVLVP